MNRKILSLFAGIAMTGTFVAAQAPQQPTSQAAPSSEAAKPADVTLTGCLVQGSSPTIFILENAKSSASESSAMVSAGSKESKGLSYLIAATATAADLRSQVNHQVSVTGTTELAAVSPSADAAGQPAASDRAKAEKDLPKLSAKTVLKIGDTCAAAD